MIIIDSHTHIISIPCDGYLLNNLECPLMKKGSSFIRFLKCFHLFPLSKISEKSENKYT